MFVKINNDTLINVSKVQSVIKDYIGMNNSPCTRITFDYGEPLIIAEDVEVVLSKILKAQRKQKRSTKKGF